MAFTSQLLVLSLWGLMGLTMAYHGADLPPGPYCGQARNGVCCSNRNDDCSYPILDSRCYCDHFCNRTIGADDCCPDYEEVCLGIHPTPPPQEQLRGCEYGDDFFRPGEIIKKRCNQCVCRYPDFAAEKYWECERDECIISEEVLYGVNREPWLGWRAANYSQFAEKKLKDGLIYKLGTLPASDATYRMGSLDYDKDIPYPREFDARTHWPNYISPIMDQGWCGSDWAVSIASIASDRLAIQSNGAERVQLSAQSLLSCDRSRTQQGCLGSQVDNAWNFVRHRGLVSENCFPYQASRVRCPYKKGGDLYSDNCPPEVGPRTSRYRMGPAGKLVKENDIKYEIMKSGPVQAVMKVYQDFFHYQDGVYRHSGYGNSGLKGLHSIKIIGWGVDQGNKYWLAANSWGTAWGENGYFRIARGENQCGIESFVVAADSDVSLANRK